MSLAFLMVKVSEEVSEDADCYRVKACLTKILLENLVVSDSSGFSPDKPGNKSEGATRVTFMK